MSSLRKFPLLIALSVIVLSVISSAQSSSDKSWTTTSQQGDPSGSVNPTRTRQTHSEVNGRTIDKTIVEALGPDGRYVPYSETERESVRVNDSTVRNVERTYGNNSDGHRTLTQETQEESRSLPGGEQKITRTTSTPDGNGSLQVARRELVDSKQVSAGVRDTKTTVFSPDVNGGLSASVQIEERSTQTDASTVQFKKSTSLADGTGRWTLGEVREGTTKNEGGASTKDERVLRPNGDGKMAVVERTVTKQADAGQGDQRATTETYSTNVPGQAGDNGLQLVQRESTIQRAGSSGGATTTRQVERPNPGDPSAGLRVTQEAIDIVRPGIDGKTAETTTILNSGSDGRMNAVWIDMGKSDKPAGPPKAESSGAKKAK